MSWEFLRTTKPSRLDRVVPTRFVPKEESAMEVIIEHVKWRVPRKSISADAKVVLVLCAAWTINRSQGKIMELQIMIGWQQFFHPYKNKNLEVALVACPAKWCSEVKLPKPRISKRHQPSRQGVLLMNLHESSVTLPPLGDWNSGVVAQHRWLIRSGLFGLGGLIPM